MRVDARRAQMLVDRGRVVLDRVAEEQRALRGEIVEPLGARSQQLEHGEEPRVSIAEIVVVPQPGGFEPRLDADRELVRREPHDVLLVEPVELLRVEHGVAAADAVEREARAPARRA